MKHLFNVARYILAGYGLLVLANNLQKVARKSLEENSTESHISEPELKDAKLYGKTDADTLKIYDDVNNLMKEHERITYSDVNRIIKEYGTGSYFFEESDDVGWDKVNFNPTAQYDPYAGCIAIFLPKAKKLAQ